MAELADIYCSDASGTAHPRMAPWSVRAAPSSALVIGTPTRPDCAILCGAKVAMRYS